MLHYDGELPTEIGVAGCRWLFSRLPTSIADVRVTLRKINLPPKKINLFYDSSEAMFLGCNARFILCDAPQQRGWLNLTATQNPSRRIRFAVLPPTITSTSQPTTTAPSIRLCKTAKTVSSASVAPQASGNETYI